MCKGLSLYVVVYKYVDVYDEYEEGFLYYVQLRM